MLELEADKYLTHVTLTSSNPPHSPKPVNIFAGLFFNCSPSLLFSMLGLKVELFSGTFSQCDSFLPLLPPHRAQKNPFPRQGLCYQSLPPLRINLTPCKRQKPPPHYVLMRFLNDNGKKHKICRGLVKHAHAQPVGNSGAESSSS